MFRELANEIILSIFRRKYHDENSNNSLYFVMEFFIKSLFCFFFLSPTLSFSQDSLVMLADTSRLNLIHHEILAGKKNSPGLEKSAKDALVLANKTKTSALIARAYSDLCLVFARNHQTAEFYELIDEAIEYCQHTQQLNSLLNIYVTQSLFYQHLGMASKLPDLSTTIIEMGKELNDYKSIYRGYLTKGDLYLWDGADFAKALEYYNLALDIAFKNKDWSNYYWAKYYIANFFNNKKEHRKAIEIYKEVIDYYEARQEFEKQLARSYNGIGSQYLRIDPPSLDSALLFLNKAHVYFDSIKYYLGLRNINLGLAKYYKRENNLKETEKYAKISLKYAKLDVKKERTAGVSKLLSEIYEQKADYKQAFFYFKEYEHWQDHHNKNDLKKQLGNQKITFDYERKIIDNEKLTIENKNIRTERQWLVLTFLLSLLALLGMLSAYKNMRKAKEKLEVLNNLQTNFFINAAHELMTPLTLILGPLKQVLKQKNIEETSIKKLNIVENNTQHLLDLASEILKTSKLGKEALALEESEIEFYDFLTTIASSFENMAKERAIIFVFNHTFDDPLYLKTDRKKLKKIIYNLLANAFKFCKKNDRIYLSVLEEKDEISIFVKDTGEGISQADLPFIFNRFYQSQNKEKLQKGGTGIGLTICKAYAQILDGTLKVESQIGNGATFILTMPKKEISEFERTPKEDFSTLNNTFTKEAPRRISNASTNGKLKPKVLIVEDNLGMQDYIQSILEPNYNCIISANGEQALQALQEVGEDIPDLIISDIMMPVMDGYTFAKKVKATTSWCGIPFIFLSARNTTLDRSIAYTIGIDDYVTKPFDDEILLAAVHNFLNKKDLEDEVSINISEKNVVEKVEITPADLKWIQEVEGYITKEMSNSQLSVSFIAEKMEISERQFRRKIKQILKVSPTSYFTEIKLQKARSLLEQETNQSVSAIGKTVGFNSTEYFSKKFKTRFGKSPFEFIRK